MQYLNSDDGSAAYTLTGMEANELREFLSRHGRKTGVVISFDHGAMTISQPEGSIALGFMVPEERVE